MLYQNDPPRTATFASPALGGRLVRRSGPARASSRTKSPAWAWIGSILGNLSSRVLREREIGRARAALYALDDWTLKDIGISRHEITLVARHGRRWR
jgi:uncharacterized protein YjiS (DUF1127 family)